MNFRGPESDEIDETKAKWTSRVTWTFRLFVLAVLTWIAKLIWEIFVD